MKLFSKIRALGLPFGAHIITAPLSYFVALHTHLVTGSFVIMFSQLVWFYCCPFVLNNLVYSVVADAARTRGWNEGLKRGVFRTVLHLMLHSSIQRKLLVCGQNYCGLLTFNKLEFKSF